MCLKLDLLSRLDSPCHQRVINTVACHPNDTRHRQLLASMVSRDNKLNTLSPIDRNNELFVLFKVKRSHATTHASQGELGEVVG